MEVYDLLFPTSEKYKGTVHLAVLTKKKEMKSLGRCTFEQLKYRIKKIDVLKSCDYYITANATKQYTKRRNENSFSLNNIVLDFDIHKRMNQQKREELIEEFVWRIKRDLFDIPAPYSIPAANVVHLTGRGVQLWFHIESASAKLIFLYHKAIDMMISIFKDFIKEYPDFEKCIEIDESASKNTVGLFRLFDTYNTHTSKKTKTEILHDGHIDLNTFVNQLAENHIIQEQKQQLESLQKRRGSGRKSVETKKKNTSYEALNRKRLWMIEKIASETENPIGRRNNLMFLAYNSALQLMPMHEARERCIEINNSFSTPLKNVEYIFNEIKTPYKYTNKTFYEKILVDDATKSYLEKEYSKLTSNLTRDAERKKKREKREEQKALAIELLKTGATYSTISKEVGLSVSSISRLSSILKIKRTKEKPWEQLGISRATYYRKQKTLP